MKIDTYIANNSKQKTTFAAKMEKPDELSALRVDTSRGLSSSNAAKSRRLFGENIISRGKKISFSRRFLSNLSDPIIRILIGAMTINILFMWGHINIPETAGIAAAVLIAAFVSTVSEHGSQAAFEKLNKSSSKSIYAVVRDGKRLSLEEEALLCGDIITINAGCLIPADCTILTGEISVNQAPLTGESIDIKKRGKAKSERIFLLSERLKLSLSKENQIFKGTLCTKGEATAVVCRVGDNTFLGGVAKDLQKETRESPLKARLSHLARQISVLGYIAAGLIMAAYVFNAFVIDSQFSSVMISERLHDLKFVASTLINSVTLGVSVIVVAVPEGLPMMITVVLSSNMKKMLKSGVLVRKMVGIETAGSMNILFTDKTGTLTDGNMSVSRIITAEGDAKTVDGEKTVSSFAPLLSGGLVSNGKKSPTELAIVNLCRTAVKGKDPSTEKLPFNSDNKYSACKYTAAEGTSCAVLGASEKLLSRCCYYLSSTGQIKLLDKTVRMRMEHEIKKEAAGCGRILALVTTEGGQWNGICRDSFEGGCLVCLFSIKDSLRKDIKAAVSEAQGAGVHVVMITGDNRETALAVAKEAGIVTKNCAFAITGEEMEKMSDEALLKMLPSLAVVARAAPADKLRLVEIAARAGLVSGMTGDGVNDAPSLKGADVGFAMGSGSDVAKEAGDIILTNNSFKSITNAILYGRTVFQSIRKFIIFQLTMNLCALGVSLICPFIGVDTPITVIQMLWVNIIMDTLGGLAFAGEIPLKKYMKRLPIKREEKILNGTMVGQILYLGIFTLGVCLAFLKIPFVRNIFIRTDDKYFMTCFFALFIFCGMFNSFNARAPVGNLFSHIAGNKAFIAIIALVVTVQLTIIYFGGEVFRCVPLYPRDILITALIALIVIPADAVRKLFIKKRL